MMQVVERDVVFCGAGEAPSAVKLGDLVPCWVQGISER